MSFSRDPITIECDDLILLSSGTITTSKKEFTIIMHDAMTYHKIKVIFIEDFSIYGKSVFVYSDDILNFYNVSETAFHTALHIIDNYYLGFYVHVKQEDCIVFSYSFYIKNLQ